MIGRSGKLAALSVSVLASAMLCFHTAAPAGLPRAAVSAVSPSPGDTVSATSKAASFWDKPANTTSSVSSTVSELQQAASSAVNNASSSAAPKQVVPTSTQLKVAATKAPTKEAMAEDPENLKPVVRATVQNSVNAPAAKEIPPKGTVSTISPAKSTSSAASSSSSSTKPTSSAALSSFSSTKPASSAASSPSSSAANSSSALSSVPSAPVQIPDGWQCLNGSRYFYYNGNPLTGWQTLNSRKYMFDSDGKLKTRTGIDVSSHQGNSIDWNQVKASGVDFVMIRIGYRGYVTGSYNKDPDFDYNYSHAKAAGLSVGAYFFSQAISVEEGAKEAEFSLDILDGRSLSEPLACDTEYVNDTGVRTNLANLSVSQRTDIVKAFCDRVSSGGYRPTVYASKYWFYDDLDVSQFLQYPIWVAHYVTGATEDANYRYPYTYWQYADDETVPGIPTQVDMDISF